MTKNLEQTVNIKLEHQAQAKLGFLVNINHGCDCPIKKAHLLIKEGGLFYYLSLKKTTYAAFLASIAFLT